METLIEINKKTREAYNKAAVKYHQLFFDELNKKEFDINLLDEFAGYFNSLSTVLDAGCGSCAHTTSYLFKKGINITGTDISEKCIEIAKRNHPGIHFEVGDFSQSNFINNSFDGILSYFSIIDTPKKFVGNILSEFKRILKPNGYLFLSVKEGKDEGYKKDLLGIKTEIYFTLFTKEEIKSYLATNGFEIIKLEQRKPYPDEIDIDRIYAIARNIE